jgi:hypothetical protein
MAKVAAALPGQARPMCSPAGLRRATRPARRPSRTRNQKPAAIRSFVRQTLGFNYN